MDSRIKFVDFIKAIDFIDFMFFGLRMGLRKGIGIWIGENAIGIGIRIKDKGKC